MDSANDLIARLQSQLAAAQQKLGVLPPFTPASATDSPPWLSDGSMNPLLVAYDNRLAELTDANVILATTLRETKSSAEEITRENARLRSELTSALEQLSAANARVSALSARPALQPASSVEIDILRSEATGLREELVQLRRASAELRQSLDDRDTAAAASTSQQRALSTTLAQTQAALRQVDGQRRAAEGEVARLASALGETTAVKDGLATQLAASHRVTAEQSERLKEYKLALEEVTSQSRSENDALLARAKQATDRARELKGQAETLASQLDATRAELARERQEHALTKSDGEQMLIVISGLEKQVLTIDEREAKAVAAERAAQAAIDDCRHKVEAASGRVEEVQREHQRLLERRKMEIAAAQAHENEAIAEVRARLLEAIAQRDGELASARQEVAAARAGIERAQRDVASAHCDAVRIAEAATADQRRLQSALDAAIHRASRAEEDRDTAVASARVVEAKALSTIQDAEHSRMEAGQRLAAAEAAVHGLSARLQEAESRARSLRSEVEDGERVRSSLQKELSDAKRHGEAALADARQAADHDLRDARSKADALSQQVFALQQRLGMASSSAGMFAAGGFNGGSSAGFMGLQPMLSSPMAAMGNGPFTGYPIASMDSLAASSSAAAVARMSQEGAYIDEIGRLRSMVAELTSLLLALQKDYQAAVTAAEQAQDSESAARQAQATAEVLVHELSMQLAAAGQREDDRCREVQEARTQAELSRLASSRLQAKVDALTSRLEAAEREGKERVVYANMHSMSMSAASSSPMDGYAHIFNPAAVGVAASRGLSASTAHLSAAPAQPPVPPATVRIGRSYHHATAPPDDSFLGNSIDELDGEMQDKLLALGIPPHAGDRHGRYVVAARASGLAASSRYGKSGGSNGGGSSPGFGKSSSSRHRDRHQEHQPSSSAHRHQHRSTDHRDVPRRHQYSSEEMLARSAEAAAAAAPPPQPAAHADSVRQASAPTTSSIGVRRPSVSSQVSSAQTSVAGAVMATIERDARQAVVTATTATTSAPHVIQPPQLARDDVAVAAAPVIVPAVVESTPAVVVPDVGSASVKASGSLTSTKQPDAATSASAADSASDSDDDDASDVDLLRAALNRRGLKVLGMMQSAFGRDDDDLDDNVAAASSAKPAAASGPTAAAPALVQPTVTTVAGRLSSPVLGLAKLPPLRSAGAVTASSGGVPSALAPSSSPAVPVVTKVASAAAVGLTQPPVAVAPATSRPPAPAVLDLRQVGPPASPPPPQPTSKSQQPATSGVASAAPASPPAAVPAARSPDAASANSMSPDAVLFSPSLNVTVAGAAITNEGNDSGTSGGQDAHHREHNTAPDIEDLPVTSPAHAADSHAQNVSLPVNGQSLLDRQQIRAAGTTGYRIDDAEDDEGVSDYYGSPDKNGGDDDVEDSFDDDDDDASGDQDRLAPAQPMPAASLASQAVVAADTTGQSDSFDEDDAEKTKVPVSAQGGTGSAAPVPAVSSFVRGALGQVFGSVRAGSATQHVAGSMTGAGEADGGADDHDESDSFDDSQEDEEISIDGAGRKTESSTAAPVRWTAQSSSPPSAPVPASAHPPAPPSSSAYDFDISGSADFFDGSASRGGVNPASNGVVVYHDHSGSGTDDHGDHDDEDDDLSGTSDYYLSSSVAGRITAAPTASVDRAAGGGQGFKSSNPYDFDVEESTGSVERSDASVTIDAGASRVGTAGYGGPSSAAPAQAVPPKKAPSGSSAFDIQDVSASGEFGDASAAADLSEASDDFDDDDLF